MKHTNKKGFTIVELVIVIAVIAILAAVLIPTFSNLIKKANVSNDTAIAKNLNTAAISAQADTFAQAIEAAKEAGYLVSHLNAKAENVYFVWDDSTNQFLLYDLKAGKVLYSNTKEYSAAGENWYFVVNNLEDKEAVLEKNDSVKIQYLVSDSNVLSSVLAQGGTETIYIDESCEISEGATLAVTTTGANITLDLGDSTLSTSGTIAGAPVFVANGASLTVKGGTLNADGTMESQYGTFNCAIGYSALEDDDPNTITKVTVVGTKFVGTTGVNGTFTTTDSNGKKTADGQVELTVTDSTFNVTSAGIILAAGNYGSTAAVNNCNVVAGGHALFASQGCTYTVNGGSYKGGTAVIYCNASTFIINGGTFEGAIDINNGGTLIINGGSFSVEIDKVANVTIAEGKTVVKNAETGLWDVVDAQ